MPFSLDPELRRVLAARIRYYREMGVYDFYRRPLAEPRREPSAEDQSRTGTAVITELSSSTSQLELRVEMSPRKATVLRVPVADEENIFEVVPTKPEQHECNPVAALRIIREDLGDCKRCVLHKQGRKQIVFGVGNPEAELMFVGEGPGADEDEQGEPFVGRAGQLLNNMIKAMGLKREEVYIANVVKCRPPGNRTPEREECETCSPFLMQQIAAIRPKVVVALGAVAAKTLLAMNASMAQLRGRFYDFKPAGTKITSSDWNGSKLAVTYHPAYLLRDPRQKGEAWKDLQMVMKELELRAPNVVT